VIRLAHVPDKDRLANRATPGGQLPKPFAAPQRAKQSFA
jgi:hypothetical protein